MTAPLVSVVTPCWNAEAFVTETIASVAAQTHPAVEHIIVDDGSIDGSWALIERWADRVTPLRLESNAGAARARNLGAARARGDYLMFLDADDLLEPRAIHALVSAAHGRPHALAVCAWGRLRRDAAGWRRVPCEIAFPPPADPLLGWLQGAWVPPCAVLWRRDTYELAGGWDEELTVNQDGELAMRALARGAQVAVADGGVLAWYRAHGGSRASVSDGTVTGPWLRSQIRALDRVAAELGSRAMSVPYAVPIGSTYGYFGRLALFHGHPELVGHCLLRSEQCRGRAAEAPTLLGRALRATLGPVRKERVAMALAQLGLGTAVRRRFVARERLAARAAGTRGASGEKGS